MALNLGSGRIVALLLTGLVAGLLAACATPEPPPAVVAVPVPESVPVVKKPVAHPPNAPLKHLANRKLEAIPDRPLNAKTTCSFRDHLGYRGNLKLDVKEAAVKQFVANVTIPKRGVCKFDLAKFRQTNANPTVVLTSRDTECKVNLWEQASEVTVAFSGCRAECTGDSVDYLWPILVDNRKGRCS
jgi:hypothetical protein